MKIIYRGQTAAEIPLQPKNFEGGRQGKTVYATIGGKEIRLASYPTIERARAVANELVRAYLADTDEFILPDE